MFIMKKYKVIGIFFMILFLFSFLRPENIQAAIKLNKTKATLYVGDTLSLNISGTTSKVKWTSSNKKVATVNNTGKVTAKSVGSVTITASISDIKCTCKITVKEKFNSANALKNLKCKYYTYAEGIIAIIKNNNSYDLSLSATAEFYDSNNTVIDKSTDYSFCLGAGNECAFKFVAPINKKKEYIDYEHYEIKYSCKESRYNDASSVLDLKHSEEADKLVIEVKNNGEKKLDMAVVSILFFKGGKVIKYDCSYFEFKEDEHTDNLEFSYPLDENSEIIVPDEYEIYLKQCYCFF